MYIDDKFIKEYDALITDRIHKARLSGEMFDQVKGRIYERILSSNSYNPKRGSMSTWLWQICRSVISNEVKRYDRSQDILDHQPIQLEDAGSIIGFEDAGTAADELTRIIRSVDLSERDEALLRAYHLDGFTSTDLADKYGMERRAVEQVIYRAMKALRESVENDA